MKAGVESITSFVGVIDFFADGAKANPVYKNKREL
jgi:hypothetical protein